MKTCYLIILFLLVKGCNSKNEPKATTVSPIAPEAIDSIIVSKQENYSSEYLKSLEEQEFPGSILFADSLLINGPDTMHFPTILNLDSAYKFSTRKENINLSVTRINYTTISYRLTDYKVLWEGYADLGPLFFLASEIDEDDITGSAYGSSEYYSRDEKLSIRIATDLDDNGILRATVNHIERDTTINIAYTFRSK
jgi:hypothetical protein